MTISAAQAEQRASALAARIASTEKLRKQLYEERRECFVALLDDGRSQASVARMFGVSPMAVALAVGKKAAKAS